MGEKNNCLFSPLPFFPPKKHVAAFQQQFHWFSPPALPYLPLISLAVLHELWGVWSHKNNIFEKLLSKTFWRKSIFTPLLPHVKLKRANPELLPCSAVLPPYEWKICPPHSKGAGVFHTHIWLNFKAHGNCRKYWKKSLLQLLHLIQSTCVLLPLLTHTLKFIQACTFKVFG